VHYLAKLEWPGSKTQAAACFGPIFSPFRLLFLQFLWFVIFFCFSLLLVFMFFPFSLSLITDTAVLKKVQQSLSFAVADEETVWRLFQHCFLSLVLYSLLPFFTMPPRFFYFCFSVSPPFSSVFFLTLSLFVSSFFPFVLSLFPLSSWFSPFLFSPQYCLLSVCSLSPPAFGFSSGFYSRRMRMFLVSRRASRWWGLSAVIRSLLDLETAPLSLPTSPSLIIKEHQLLQTMTWWNGAAWFILVQPLNFLQLCNQILAKIVIVSLNFSDFSGLVLGFGLFQLNP